MASSDTEERAVAAYLGLAIGDALGATVEFMTPREIRAQYGVHDQIRGGGWLRLKPGRVTDDTEMALALGESILTAGRVEAEVAAQAFDRWMRSKPIDIGNTVRRGILHYRNTGIPQVPPSEHDAGNGALMRLLPAAIATLHLPPAEIERATLAQARVTHHHPLSDSACLACTRALHMALTGSDRLALLHGPVKQLVAAEPKFNFRKRRQENPSGYVVDTLRAVLQSLFDTDSFEQCLIDVVNRGGDADTTGAIAGMLAGAVYGLEAIPKKWLGALTGSVKKNCEQQAKALVTITTRRASEARC